MTDHRIDFYASHVHYLDHLAPIWHQLDKDIRGEFLAGAGTLAEARARTDYDITTTSSSNLEVSTRAVVAASFGDIRDVGRRPVILLEHGAGQTYSRPGHPSGPGGDRRGHVVLFLNPNDTVAEANRRAYPRSHNATIGVPKLDPWHSGQRPRPNNPTPVVAVSFSWDRPLEPESKSAYRHYRKHLHRLARAYPGALGHGHPRRYSELIADYRRAGLKPTPRFSTVLDTADVYVCDNSSTLYEFASTGRPVVVLNAPWYRRDIEHGLRFWEYADVGLQVDDPADLNDTIARALEDPDEVATRRQTIIESVYSHTDGNAARRATEAIMALITSRTTNGRCGVCGSDDRSCSRGHSYGDPVDVPESTKESTTMTNQPATFRVTRVINGHAATVKVRGDELTDKELEDLGLTRDDVDPKTKRRAARDKARTADATPNKADDDGDDDDVSRETSDDDEDAGDEPAADIPAPPAKSANKPVWEAYAAGLGIDVADKNKAQIIDAVEALEVV